MSTTKLWATASKEWVIQPKPRPGRKPKTDLAPSSANESSELEPKARRVQNRAAQRAFRERKQSQLLELQARVQSYEQGEMDKTVGLQKIAKQLKEENDKLRRENRALQTRIAEMEHVNKDLPPVETDKKRWRDDSPSSAPYSQLPVRKKSRVSSDTYPCLPAFSQTYLPSPSPLVSTPDSNETAKSHFSALPCDSRVDLDPTLFSHPDDFEEPDANTHPLPPFSCGFCDEGTLCVCHEIVTSQVVSIDRDSTSPEVKLDAASSSQAGLLVCHDTRDTNMKLPPIPTDGNLSILDDLPEYQPPVPLKRRSGGTSVNSVFPVQPAPTFQGSRIGTSNPTCSGDPSNCMICANDSFGKAFCTAITTSTCTACYEFPDQFGSGVENCKNGLRREHLCSSGSSFPATAPSSSEFIPTNDAWQKLKAHPNVDFADLSLLAEVVASRTKCSGPQFVISSTPPQMRGERTSGADRHGGDSPIRLVDEKILLECGRRRVQKVHTDGVREALRMLDAKFC